MNYIQFPKDGYVKIPVEGKVEVVNTDKPFPFEEIRKFCDGYVALVPMTGLSSNSQTWCDEEGLMKGSKPNKNASEILNQELVGNVLILFGKARSK